MKKLIGFAGIALTMTMLSTPASALCLFNCGGGGNGGDGKVSANFGGSILSENQAVSEGGLVGTMTKNWKNESGFANAYQSTDGPDWAEAGASVSTGGLGSAFSANGGFGSSSSLSGVLGNMEGGVFAETAED